MELMIDDRNCTIDDWRLRKSVDLRPNIGSAIADGARVSTADDLQSRVEAFADLSIKFAAGLPDTYLVRRMAGQFQASIINLQSSIINHQSSIINHR
jgi:hypothetical protein